MDPTSLNNAVNTKYSGLAQTSLHRGKESNIQADHDIKAASFGYDPNDLKSLPEGANLGLSCGAPLNLAQLNPGEIVLDLGSGGGLDCLLAAKAVGPEGKVIGVDRSIDMLQLARRNAKRMGVDSFVLFVEGDITQLPLEEGTVDVVLSNCVLNLVPHSEKPKVFAEIFRVLRPGGRVAVSDILEKRDMPVEVRHDVALIVGCVAGASPVAQYEEWMSAVGFVEVKIADTEKDLNIFKGECSVGAEQQVTNGSCTMTSGCCGTSEKLTTKATDSGRCMDFNEWVGAYQICAIKPDGRA
jgi:arsenite methyltransferase